MTKEEKLREKFEAWAIQPPYEFDITKFEEHESWSNSYKNYHVQCAWNGYKAANADCEAEFEQVAIKSLDDVIRTPFLLKLPNNTKLFARKK